MFQINTDPGSQVVDAYNGGSGLKQIDLDNDGSGLEYFKNQTGRPIQVLVLMSVTSGIAGSRFTAGAAVNMKASFGLATVFASNNRVFNEVDFTEEALSLKRLMEFEIKTILDANQNLTIALTSDNVDDNNVQIGSVRIFDMSPGAISYSANGFPQVDSVEVASATPAVPPTNWSSMVIDTMGRILSGFSRNS